MAAARGCLFEPEALRPVSSTAPTHPGRILGHMWAEPRRLGIWHRPKRGNSGDGRERSKINSDLNDPFSRKCGVCSQNPRRGRSNEPTWPAVGNQKQLFRPKFQNSTLVSCKPPSSGDSRAENQPPSGHQTPRSRWCRLILSTTELPEAVKR